MVEEFPIFLVLVVGLYYNLVLFDNLDKDTTQITNAAFALVISIASVSFGFSRALSSDDQDRDRVVFAGERFFHAAIALLAASILKYATLSLNQAIGTTAWYVYLVSFVVGLSIPVLFASSLLSVHTGLRILNRILWNRSNRYKDWDSVL